MCVSIYTGVSLKTFLDVKLFANQFSFFFFFFFFFFFCGTFLDLKVNMSIVCAHTVNATSFFRAGFYVTSSNVTRER